MMFRTHLAISVAVALYFMPLVNNPWIFVPIVLISGLMPDIDSGMSGLGRKIVFKPVQMMTNHRGIFHTYTLCIALSILFALFIPSLALPFFLGYSFHLFSDSFTSQGIKPFWPFKYVSKGVVRSGGRTDAIIFYCFVSVDVVLILTTLFRVF